MENLIFITPLYLLGEVKIFNYDTKSSYHYRIGVYLWNFAF